MPRKPSNEGGSLPAPPTPGIGAGRQKGAQHKGNCLAGKPRPFEHGASIIPVTVIFKSCQTIQIAKRDLKKVGNVLHILREGIRDFYEKFLHIIKKTVNIIKFKKLENTIIFRAENSHGMKFASIIPANYSLIF